MGARGGAVICEIFGDFRGCTKGMGKYEKKFSQ